MKLVLKLFVGTALLAVPAFAEEDSENGPDTRPFVYLDEESIENNSDNAKANFGGLINRLNHEVTACGLHRVITSKDVGRGLKDDQLFKSIATKFNGDRELQQPALRIILTIMKYGFVNASGADLYGKASAVRQAKIELILRVVDIKTSETLKSKNVERSATGTATAESNLQEQVLQEANKAVVADIVAELVKLTPFSVLDVENGEVVVDVPANRVKPGQQLCVFKKGKKVKNKRTGKVTAKESQVATIGVVTLSEDSVTCKLLSGEIKPEEGAEDGEEYDKYIVRIPDIPVAVAAPVAIPSAPAPSKAAVPF